MALRENPEPVRISEDRAATGSARLPIAVAELRTLQILH
jgi:hypothetical protein